MKRKIIKQANQAYTITLPIDWVRENKIDENSEVEVTIEGKTLNINTNNQTKGEKVTLNLEGIESERTIYQSLNALYAKGIDEIEVICSRDISSILTKSTSSLIGLALVSKSKNIYLIKDISGSSYTDLEEIFKRVFQMILLFYDDAQKDILGKEKQTLEDLKERDLEVNKFCLYLQRAVNKKYYKDSVDGRVLFNYSFALEEIGDEIMRMWRTNVQHKIKKTNEIKELMELCKKSLEESFDIYYQFNLSKIKQIYIIRENMREKASKLKNIDGKSLIFLKNLIKISEEAADLSHLTLMRKL